MMLSRIVIAIVLIAFVAVLSAPLGDVAETRAVAQLAVPAVVDTAIALAATRECFACSREPNQVRGAHEPLRGSGRMLALYARLALEDEINGYLNVPSYAAFAVVYAAQRAAGVWGAVGEIGVHHGRSFILAALLSSPSEPLWVLDLFEELQALNVDSSGSGSFAALSRNMARVGLDIAAASVERRSSADLPADYFCSGGMPRFRFFSVDGGHTEKLTRLDMTTARCHLAEGGVIAVDDIFNNLFLGVTEGGTYMTSKTCALSLGCFRRFCFCLPSILCERVWRNADIPFSHRRTTYRCHPLQSLTSWP